MLHLQSESTSRWLHQVDEHLDEILIDHAHCERKAASTAMNLMNAYLEDGRESPMFKKLVEKSFSTLGRRLEGLELVSEPPIIRNSMQTDSDALKQYDEIYVLSFTLYEYLYDSIQTRKTGRFYF